MPSCPLALLALIAHLAAPPGLSQAAGEPAPAPAAASQLSAAAPSAEAVATPAAAPASEQEEVELPPEPALSLDDPFLAQVSALKDDARAKIRSPEAALPLLRAFALRERLPTLVPLVQLYGQFAESSLADPQVRSVARYLLGQVERSRGRLPRAHEHFSKLGFLTRFQVIGPFDNEGKAGCATTYPPEASLDLAGRYPGKAREVGWRKLPDLARDGYVDLGAAISPSDETTVYALTVVEAPADQKAVIRLGASGAVRLFLNGTRVVWDDSYHPPRFDQLQVGVTLRKGSNRLLLKLCQDVGPHGFFLRVTGANGEALPGLTHAAPETLVPPPKGGPAIELMPGTVVEHFRKRADANKADARARAEYAEMLMYWQAFDVKDRRDAAEAAAAAKLAPRDAAIQALAAATAKESNDKRAYLEAALAAQPGFPSAALSLAQHQLGQEYPRRALATLEPALAAAPTWFPLSLAKARALEAAGLSHASQELFLSLARRFPDRAEVLREAARVERRRDHPREAAALYRVALGLRYDDSESRRSLVQLLTELGDVKGALKEQRELTELEPWNVSAWLKTGELAAVNGFSAESSAAFAKARSIAPEDAEVHEREGRILAYLGDTPAAVASLSRSLALKPQDPQVREALKSLRPEEKGFGEELAHDVRALVAEVPPAAGEDSQVLADLTAVRVLPSGLAQRFEQTVVRVQTARGVESERSQWITYSPDRQDLKILRARVIRPDGSVIESHTEADRSLSDEASKLYYDARGRIVGFPNLAPGDVIELAFRLDDTASDNLLSDYFGDLSSIQSRSPKARFDYWLLAPKGRTIYSNQPSVKVEREEKAQPDGTRLYHWSAREVPKIVPEPRMPGLGEVAATLHVSTYKDWDSVGRYYWGLVRDQLVATDEIKAALKEIAVKVPPGDELAMIRAVYGFVVSRTRYVGLEFGIHGYKPYKVDKVLARRFGDCKDKASLMHALLQVAGIDSRLVLLRMKRQGALPPDPASLAVFDHAILYVPKYDLWLDGTAELFGSRELPIEDRGAMVLVVEPRGGSKLGRIPEGKAADNVTATAYEAKLAPTGAASISGRTTVAGLSAPDYRRTYQVPDTRKQSFEAGWARSFPGVSVKELVFQDLEDIEKDVTLSFALEIPRFAQLDEGALSFNPFGEGATYVESFAPLSERKHDLVLAFPWINRSAYRFALPDGFAPKDLPKDVAVQSPFGAVSVKYRVEGGALTVEGEVMLGVSRVPASEYPAFRSFLGQVDQALGRKIKLERALKLPETASR